MKSFLLKFLLIYILNLIFVYSNNSNKYINLDESNTPDYKFVKNCFHVKKINRMKPANYSTSIVHGDDDNPFVWIDNIIDEIDARNVLILMKCIQRYFPTHYQSRAFESTGFGGGYNITYVNDLMKLNMPDLYQLLYHVINFISELANWRPNAKLLGIRVVEVLEYKVGSELLWHTDRDSIYTLVIMLSDHNNFTGGDIHVQRRFEDGKLAYLPYDDNNTFMLTPKQYGGIILDSNAEHAVGAITSGERTVLVVEFWPFADSVMSHYRPSPDNHNGYKIPYFYIADKINHKKSNHIEECPIYTQNQSLSIHDIIHHLSAKDIILVLFGIIVGMVVAPIILFYPTVDFRMYPRKTIKKEE